MAIRWSKRLIALLAAAVLAFLAVRVRDTQRGPPLHVWHTYVPHELTAEELDSADWAKYLETEAKIFDDLRQRVRPRQIGPCIPNAAPTQEQRRQPQPPPGTKTARTVRARRSPAPPGPWRGKARE